MQQGGTPFENCAWFMPGMTANGRMVARCLHLLSGTSCHALTEQFAKHAGSQACPFNEHFGHNLCRLALPPCGSR